LCINKVGINFSPRDFMTFGELIRPSCALAGLILLFLLPMCAVAQANPPGFDQIAQKAAAARERDDVPQAIELYSQALQLQPGWSDGWWFLGSLEYQAEAYSAGRDALTHYLDLVPDAGPAWALRGLCEFETQDYTKSLTDIQQGLSLGAGKEAGAEKILRYHEALLLTRRGNFEGALQLYRPLTRGKIPNPELLVGIGLAGLRTPLLPGDLSAEQRDLHMAAGHAAFLFMSGDEKAAQPEFGKLFQRFPTAENAHYLYGSLLSPTDPDQALTEFKRELEISPSNAAAQLMVAWDSLTRNDSATALAYAKKVVAEEPTLPMARLVLGRSLVETGDVTGGTELLEKELQLEPDSLEIHFALARAYSKSGRKEDARRERLLCLRIENNAPTQQAHR
jgi:tetratricopeptide (TPR) repeat protein